MFTSTDEAQAELARILPFEAEDWNALVTSLKEKSPDPLAALELIKVITDVSEYIEGATWDVGCEYKIWRRLLKEDVLFSRSADIYTEHKKSLVRLQKKCGGWWQWDSNLEELPTFMTTQEWIAHVKK